MRKRSKKKPFVIGEKQQAAVKMLIDGDYKVQEVAAALNVNRSTVWRWFQHPEMRAFCERYYRKRIAAIKRDIRRGMDRKRARLEAKLTGDNPYVANAIANRVIDVYLGRLPIEALFRD